MVHTKRHAMNDSQQILRGESSRSVRHDSKHIKGEKRRSSGPRPDALESTPSSGFRPSTAPRDTRENSPHLQWSSLMKTHLGVLESHISLLQQKMQNLLSNAELMSVNDRQDWESDEKGEWQIICQSMNHAKEIQAQARKLAKGILSESRSHNKKRPDSERNIPENYEPQKKAERQVLGHELLKARVGRTSDSGVYHSAGETSNKSSATKHKLRATSRPESENEVLINAELSSPQNHSKASPKKKTIRGKKSVVDTSPSSTNGAELDPYYLTSLNTISHLPTETSTRASRKSRKKVSDVTQDAAIDRKTRHTERDRKKAASRSSHTEKQEAANESDVDFAALQAQLLAEIEASERQKRESLARLSKVSAGKESKKKRRRSSDLAEAQDKKAKKESKKRKADVSGTAETKKDRKRKAEACALDEKDAVKPKKRKHKKDDS